MTRIVAETVAGIKTGTGNRFAALHALATVMAEGKAVPATQIA
jgi:hypothetical protein